MKGKSYKLKKKNKMTQNSKTGIRLKITMENNTHPNQISKLIDAIHGHWGSDETQLDDSHFLEVDKILLENDCDLQSQNLLILYNTNEICRRTQFIQILFDGNTENGHYICVYCDGFLIRVYDSMNRKNLSDFQIGILRKMLPKISKIPIIYEEVQQQEQPYNCGLFAIGFKLALVHNICPCKVEFIEDELRNEFTQFILSRQLRLFKFTNKNKGNWQKDITPIKRITDITLINHTAEPPLNYIMFSNNKEKLITNKNDMKTAENQTEINNKEIENAEKLKKKFGIKECYVALTKLTAEKMTLYNSSSIQIIKEKIKAKTQTTEKKNMMKCDKRKQELINDINKRKKETRQQYRQENENKKKSSLTRI